MVVGGTLLVAAGVARMKEIRTVSQPPQESIQNPSEAKVTEKPAERPVRKDDEWPLDPMLQSGFGALRNKKWPEARKHFEDAVAIFEQKHCTSKWLFTKLSLSPSNSSVTVNGKPKDVSSQVDGYRELMGTQQALYEFTAFSTQLSGDDRNAEAFFTKTEDLRGVMWG